VLAGKTAGRLVCKMAGRPAAVAGRPVVVAPDKTLVDMRVCTMVAGRIDAEVAGRMTDDDELPRMNPYDPRYHMARNMVGTGPSCPVQATTRSTMQTKTFAF